MKNLLALVIFVLIPFSLFAQKSVRKATAPKAVIVSVENGKEQPLSSMQFGKDNLVKITVAGGVQNIDHKLYVTSTNAVVKMIAPQQYLVTPVGNEKVELIVDIETFEDYYFYQLKPKGKKRKMKKVLTSYPPEKYMVGFETYTVIK